MRKPARSRPSVARMVEDVVGCKWSLSVLGAVRSGVRRPGALEREIAGITTKVLNERLAKMVRFEILEKRSYPEIPPRVEYRLTRFGQRFVGILDRIDALQAELEGAAAAATGRGRRATSKLREGSA